MIRKCLIVDDESIARELLTDYVEKVPELELVAACSTAIEAMPYIKEGQVDILLLDIQMPDLTGLDFLKVLSKRPLTILTTAYSEYAVQSYELGVVDYLLKPIEFDRFYMAISKATGIFCEPEKTNLETGKPATDKLFIKSDKKVIKVDIADILTINAKGAYTEFVMSDGRKIISLQSMSKLEESLPSSFFRTHRSFIININQINYIEGNTISVGNQKVIISKNKREEFFRLIDGSN